jgi:hypothetical protein
MTQGGKFTPSDDWGRNSTRNILKSIEKIMTQGGKFTPSDDWGRNSTRNILEGIEKIMTQGGKFTLEIKKRGGAALLN